MSEQQKDAQTADKDQVPGGGLSGNDQGASSDGDSGPEGAGGATASGEAREDEAQSG